MFLIFDNTGALVMTSSVLPSSHTEEQGYTNVVVEDYDDSVSYSLVDGEIVTGELPPADEAEMARLDAEFEAEIYKYDRANEYPSIGDQLDALFHAGVFPQEMADQIQATKDKYPKET